MSSYPSYPSVHFDPKINSFGLLPRVRIWFWDAKKLAAYRNGMYCEFSWEIDSAVHPCFVKVVMKRDWRWLGLKIIAEFEIDPAPQKPEIKSVSVDLLPE